MRKARAEVLRPSDDQIGDVHPKLSPRDIRSLHVIREPHVDQIVDAAALLDEGERKLAVRLLRALLEHRRSSLS